MSFLDTAGAATIMYLADKKNPAGLDQPSGDSFDAETFFSNAAKWMPVVGGVFLAFIGIAGVVWGGFLLVRKLMAGQQNQDNWLKIVALIVTGGALAFGGITLLTRFAAGGQKTIEDFGSNGSGTIAISTDLGNGTAWEGGPGGNLQ